jgi:hypothetical protein
MNTYVILRRSGWASRDDLEKAASRSSRVGREEMPDRVRWMRSYITDEPNSRLGTVCVYEATDPDAVREHATRAGLPCDVIIPVSSLVIVNDDEMAVLP